MKTYILFFAVILVSIFACTKSEDAPASLEGTDQAIDLRGENPIERPWKGVFNTALTANNHPCYETAGEGIISHMGKATTSSSYCFYNPYCTSGTTNTVAANGDEVHSTFDQCTVNIEYPIMYVEGTFQVTGGTGRFANASGSGTQSTVWNLETHSGTTTVDGTIVY